MEKSYQVVIRLDQDLAARLAAAAAEEERPVSRMAAKIIRDWLKTREAAA